MRLQELANRLECKLEDESQVEILGVATLEEAQQGDLSFLSNPKYYPEAKATKASAVVVGPDCPPLHTPRLIHANPYLVFAKAIELFYPPQRKEGGVHPTAVVSPDARLGSGVAIGAYAVVEAGALIGDGVEIGPHCVVHAAAQIGPNSMLHAGCVIRERVRIGNHCIVQSNAVIGSDGFGYAKQDDGSWYKISQTGAVVLEDYVEIGAGTTIDRATIGETRIRKGAKIDNLVQIGHSCAVGENSLLCAQVGLAGSTRVGRNVILAGQVGSAGHLDIGDGVVATGQTGIPSSVEPGKVISGSPSFDNRQWLKSTLLFQRFPELQRTIRDIVKRLAKLEAILKG